MAMSKTFQRKLESIMEDVSYLRWQLSKPGSTPQQHAIDNWLMTVASALQSAAEEAKK